MSTEMFDRPRLVAAFTRWEQDRREGRTMDHASADGMSIAERAEASADALIAYLTPADDFPLGKACDLTGEGGCEACQ